MPLVSQQPAASPAPLDLTLRCTGVQSVQQSRAVKSASYGFGNPTNPDEDEFTKHVDRLVLVELHGTIGRIRVPQSVLAVEPHPAPEGWFSLENVVATPDVITASVKLNAKAQTVRLDRRTGAAELIGYGPQVLRGVCRVERKPQPQF